MGIEYNTSEFLEMAEEIERNGAAFYAKAADRFRDTSIADLLRSFAEMEQAHEKTFAHMRRSLDGENPALSPYDPGHPSVQYIQAMAQGQVFDPSGLANLDTLETPMEILSVALGAEKDSIVFYLGLKGLCNDAKSREALEGILAEEMEHVQELSQVRATLLESQSS